jgi:hypothetical protein
MVYRVAKESPNAVDLYETWTGPTLLPTNISDPISKDYFSVFSTSKNILKSPLSLYNLHRVKWVCFSTVFTFIIAVKLLSFIINV